MFTVDVLFGWPVILVELVKRAASLFPWLSIARACARSGWKDRFPQTPSHEMKPSRSSFEIIIRGGHASVIGWKSSGVFVPSRLTAVRHSTWPQGRFFSEVLRRTILWSLVSTTHSERTTGHKRATMTTRNSTKRKSDQLDDHEQDNETPSQSDEDSVTRHLHTFHAKETKGTFAEIQNIHAEVRRYIDVVGLMCDGNELEEGQRKSLEEFLSDENLNRLKARFPNLDIQELQGCSSDDSYRLYCYLDHYVARPLQGTLEKFSGVRNDLKEMAAFANKTETKSTATASEDECTEEHFKYMMRGVHIDSPGAAQ